MIRWLILGAIVVVVGFVLGITAYAEHLIKTSEQRTRDWQMRE